MEIISLWKTHYSLKGRSILTLEKAGNSTPTEPDSVIDLCLQHSIKDVYLVEDSFSGFLEAYTNCKASGLNLRFGLRITFCANITDKDEESLTKSCKYIIFIKNEAGYKRLIKLFAIANRIGFYYEPRLDFKTLKEHWDSKDLLLAIPFYDSFLFNNHLTSSLCIPDFTFCEPRFFIESNELPFDSLIERRVLDFCKDKYEVIKAQSIYYTKRSDFLAFLTFKCLAERGSLQKPNLDHMCSSEFCLESYLEKINE